VANLSVRNLSQIRQMYPQIGEALDDIQKGINNTASQVNASPVGITPAPRPHAANSVLGGAGMLDVSVTDNTQQFRGNQHFFDYSTDGFKTFHTKPMGPAKNWRGSLGTGTFQVRSYTQYPTSGPSQMLYHAPVSTAGTTEPAMQAGQGSGTGTAGFGQQPYNATVPPKRS
jgi:hypothetical protein